VRTRGHDGKKRQNHGLRLKHVDVKHVDVPNASLLVQGWAAVGFGPAHDAARHGHRV
jgi:hypothetical protein